MKKFIKIILILLLIITSYVVISIIVSKSNQFVNYYFFSSDSILDSKKNNFFISKIDMNKVTYDLDEKTMLFFKTNTVIWIDKYEIEKSFGMLNLFPLSKTNDLYNILNIDLNNPNDKFRYELNNQYFIKINNSDFETFQTFSGIKVDKNANISIEVYSYKTKLKLGEIRFSLSNIIVSSTTHVDFTQNTPIHRNEKKGIC